MAYIHIYDVYMIEGYFIIIKFSFSKIDVSVKTSTQVAG